MLGSEAFDITSIRRFKEGLWFPPSLSQKTSACAKGTRLFKHWVVKTIWFKQVVESSQALQKRTSTIQLKKLFSALGFLHPTCGTKIDGKLCFPRKVWFAESAQVGQSEALGLEAKGTGQWPAVDISGISLLIKFQLIFFFFSNFPLFFVHASPLY